MAAEALAERDVVFDWVKWTWHRRGVPPAYLRVGRWCMGTEIGSMLQAAGGGSCGWEMVMYKREPDDGNAVDMLS
jgi:hypothetical protein